MRILRRRSVHKAISVFLLLIFVQSLFPSYWLYALTTGPHQPEYTSYEAPGATDMVNLLTGDFTTSLPILEVPGPEGSFQVPLSYHGGIGLDQEGSWVGVGWTLNVGAITRSYFGYPDDAAGEVNEISVHDFGFSGVELNTFVVGKMGYNNLEGAYGSLNFLNLVNFSYTDGQGSVGVAGINVSDNGNVSFNAVQFASAAATVLSLGAAAAGLSELTVAQEVAKDVATDIAMNVALESSTFTSAPSMSANGYWQYQKKERRIWPFLKVQRLWLDQTRLEEMFGTIYVHKPELVDAESLNDQNHSHVSLMINDNLRTMKRFSRSANNKGAASDIYINNAGNYIDAVSPAILATDKFSVKAPGIAGSIKPYRLETGSVSVQRDMTKFHNRLVPVPFENYKVPFIYEGSNSNAYYYHVGGSQSVNAPVFYYGLSNALGSTDPSINATLKFDFDDISLGSQRIKPEVASANHKIAQANHIEWLTNEDISNTVGGFSNRFMDYFSGTARSDFREVQSFGGFKAFYSSSEDFTNGVIRLSTASDLDYFAEQQPVTVEVTAYNTEEEFQVSGTGGTTYSETSNVITKNATDMTITVGLSNQFISNISGKYCNIYVTSTSHPKSPKSIGGFSITSPQGVTYHFALPIYDYSNYTRSQNPTDDTKYSIIQRKEPFANTWLLTGITGPDFIDRGGSNNAGNGVIDEGDWGYWVKFNYGKYTDNFMFRSPWSEFTLDASGSVKSYTEGMKQLYYLNSIETRSHVALFLKGVRADNKGKNGATSLRLEEVVLLTREQYKRLGAPTASNGFDMTLCSGNIAKIWLSSDFYALSGTHPPQGRFLINNALKRIRFGYDYALCPGVPNSDSGGKLTLKRVSILGRSDQMIVPDYKFEYSGNYAYNADQWDGWGMYNPSATQNARAASDTDSYGTAWSLNKIVTPLGAEILVDLERDTYASVSGEKLWSPVVTNFDYDYGVTDGRQEDLLSNKINVWGTSGLNEEDKIFIEGTIEYRCSASEGSQLLPYEKVATIDDITGNYITLNEANYTAVPCLTSDIVVEKNSGTIKTLTNKKGGDVRVKSIVMKNEYGQENKIRYIYDDDDGYSTGAVAQEPDFIKSRSFSFYDFPGYPFTPVMYGRVSVLNGKLTSDTDYHTKQVYEFETPRYYMYSFTKDLYSNKRLIYSRHVEQGWGDILDADVYYKDHLTEVKYTLDDRTAKIGSLKSIKTYDQTSLKGSVEMIYDSAISNPDGVERYQGTYSEGTIMFDQIIDLKLTQPDEIQDLRYYKTNRTSILSHPYVLKQVVNTKDGFASSTVNDSWDFISGQVLEKTSTSALGVKTQSVAVPAYTVYPEMGSKAANIENRNMLLQEAATYAYRLDEGGNRLGLISATAQTWRSDWSNYRSYDAVSQSFQDTDDEPSGVGIWRKGVAYVWKGDYSRLQQSNGKQAGYQSFSASDEFDFAATASNAGWKRADEFHRFDHYGMPLESSDINNIYSALKMGYDQRKIVAEASNAGYNEIAFCSAEDEDAGFFGAEVQRKDAVGDATVVRKTSGGDAHTGQSSLSLSAGYGFIFKPVLRTGKRYKALVWTNSANGRLYYKLNGGSEVLSDAPASTRKVGNWYLIEVQFDTPATFSSCEVGVKSTGGQVLFDDFRFQPVDAVMTCHVYDPVDKEYAPDEHISEYVLNNNNLFTQFEYDGRGRLIKTYQESIKYGVTLVNESKDNYRRFHVDQ